MEIALIISIVIALVIGILSFLIGRLTPGSKGAKATRVALNLFETIRDHKGSLTDDLKKKFNRLCNETQTAETKIFVRKQKEKDKNK